MYIHVIYVGIIPIYKAQVFNVCFLIYDSVVFYCLLKLRKLRLWEVEYICSNSDYSKLALGTGSHSRQPGLRLPGTCGWSSPSPPSSSAIRVLGQTGVDAVTSWMCLYFFRGHWFGLLWHSIQRLEERSWRTCPGKSSPSGLPNNPLWPCCSDWAWLDGVLQAGEKTGLFSLD